MSQRPSASRPASRSPSEGHKITLPPVQVRDDSRHGGRQADRQSEQESRGTQQHHQILPSPQPTRTPQPGLAGDDWRNFGPSRDLGVHSILNPPEGESASASSRPFSGGPTDSPLSTTRQISHFGASPSTTAAHPFSSRQSLPVSTSPSENINPNFARNPHRRMLTPRSPRPVSIGRAPVSGTINAQDSPFLPPRRPYMGETSHTPVSETPPMPTPPPPGQAQAQHYGFPSSGPNTAERRSENPHKQAAGVTQHSTSPSMSTSSQNPSSSQTSPASGYPYYQGGQNPPTSGSYFPGSSFGTPVQQGGGSQLQGPPAASEGPYTAPQMSSSLHSNTSSRQAPASEPYGVLTITTAQGVAYHVPVDTHQASRLADEKRARNAGASARFRQRRKEKEKEASSNIEKLQQQNRDLERRLRETEGDRDFYRSERNRFRDVLLRNPGMREAAMHAPPSPRTMRPMSYPGPSPQGGPSAMAYQSDTAERPARRRRTDAQGEFTNVPYSHSPASTLPPVQSGFAPSHSQGLPSLPPLRIDNAPTSATTGAPTSSVSAGPTSYEPFSRGPYDRGWPGDGAGRR
ncbi:hypothetical protein ACMFMF_008768 [Clarireedia jacksonii]